METHFNQRELSSTDSDPSTSGPSQAQMLALPLAAVPAPPVSNPQSFNPFSMMHPTFAGSPGEDVEMYIKQCKWAWAGSGIPESDLSEAQATTLYTGLSGIALEFSQSLDDEACRSFTELSKKLRVRFPVQRRAVNRIEILRRIVNLQQGDKTFEEYVDLGLDLHCAVGADFRNVLADQWIDGLKHTRAAPVVRLFVSEKRKEGHMAFYEVVQIARAALGPYA